MTAERNLVKINIRLQQDEDDYPPSDVETVWAEEVNGRLLIDSIPFYAYQIAPGDEIVVSKDADGLLWFVGVKHEGGASVFRIYCKHASTLDQLRTQLIPLGCKTEIHRQACLLAIEIPAEISSKPILSFFEIGKREETFDFEEAALRHTDWQD